MARTVDPCHALLQLHPGENDRTEGRQQLGGEDALDRREAMRAIPALIKGYLRLNGFVGDGAYIDREFNTVDVCLIMETSRIADRYRKFYTGKTTQAMERILG